jgi:primosomal protein N' (replication factor Y)
VEVRKRATRLRAVLDILGAHRHIWVDADQLRNTHSQWREALRALEERGHVERTTLPAMRAVPVEREPDRPPMLNETQVVAVTRIIDALGGFRRLLLHGVTGSGKTEVYLQAIAAVVARGEQALVLAPEIALTPQLIARFAARFRQAIAVLHSSLADGERLAAWRAARSGEAAVVIGTRSAVFAPLAKVGLIIVDEEHDAAYKQQEGFRYSARDLAVVRAQREGIPVLLGSATPSLESLWRTQQQPEDLLPLPVRAGGAKFPALSLIDLRRYAAQQGLSTPVMLGMRRHLDAGGQVLLYLNRRGYAPVLFCPSCGWAAPCKRCDARMTVHKRTQRLLCHHCGYEALLPTVCPDCQAPVKPMGQGTERIEETLLKVFPDAPLARIDRDSVSRKGELEAVLERVNSGAAKILVGTQMLSKGHDFPNVTLAVILNADQGLFGTDFRSSERLAQTIVQVAGRAGRAAQPGEVLIQTEYPEHPLLRCLVEQGYSAFAAAALQERAAAHWPPFTRLALLRAEANRPEGAHQFLELARRSAERHAHGVRILGPAPAPMVRRAGMHRAQLLLQSNTHAPLQKLLAILLPELETLPAAKRVRWSVDVDPAELF